MTPLTALSPTSTEGTAPRCSPILARGPVATPPPHATLVEALEAGARADAPFVTLHDAGAARPLDARAALEGARRWAGLLHGRGVRPGDRVPLLLPTSEALIEALLGTLLLRAVPVPLASPMTFGAVDRYLHNLAAVIEDAEAWCIVTTPRMRTAIAADARLQRFLFDAIVPDDLLGAARLHAPERAVDPTDTALIQYTSGTTGRPKGVVLSHRAITANAAAIARGLGIGPDDVGVSWLPLFHDMGLIGVLLTALCHPYPIHLVRPEAFVMQPRRWLSLIAKLGGTIATAPNFAYELCVRRGGDVPGTLERWRLALDGAEPVHAATLERFTARYASAGFRSDAFMPVYGLAECTLAVTMPPPGAPVRVLHVDRATLEPGQRVVGSSSPDAFAAVSVGRPVEGVAVRIGRPDGSAAPEGVVGEVQVAGPSVMSGYFRRAAASSKVLRDGFLCTGDLGFLTDGCLFVVGRAKDVIIKGGQNIHPHDVERVVADVPGVTGAAAAFGRPNGATGTDDLVVVVECRGTDEAKRERVARDVRGALLAVLGVKADEVYLWPVGALPRTTSGKIRRAECARRVKEEQP